MARPCATSRFPVSLDCSVLLQLSPGILFFVLSFRLGCLLLLTCGAPLPGVQVSVFACQLLRRFLATSRCPIWLLALPFRFLVPPSLLSVCGSASLFSTFSCPPSCTFSLCVITCVSLPLVFPPLSDRSLLLGTPLPPLLLPSGGFCCLVHCFAFLRISRLASAWSFLVLPVLWLCL